VNRAAAWILVAAGLAASCARVDRQLFSGLDRTGGVILSEVPRVSLARYRELFNAYTTELTAAHARAQTGSERSALEPYDAAAAGLKDVLAVWDAKETSRSDMLPLADEMAARVAKTYSLPVNTNEPPSIYASEAMQLIWGATKDALTRATTH
jgi:hypothetical protein